MPCEGRNLMGTMLELYLPVIDGDDPAAWTIWGERLEKLGSQDVVGDRGIPTDLLDLAQCRLIIALHSPDALFDRTASQWDRVVGVLVDGDPAKRRHVTDSVRRICKGLLDSPTAEYRNLGFHIGVLTPTQTTQSDIDFAFELEEKVRTWLSARVVSDAVGNSEWFRYMIRSFDKAIVSEVIRRKQGGSS
jgi:hypothetical protein